MKVTAGFVLTFLLGLVPLYGKERAVGTCATKFLVVYVDFDLAVPVQLNIATKDVWKWWREKAKKYPQICRVEEAKDANAVVALARWTTSRPVLSTVTKLPTLYNCDNVSGSFARGFCQGMNQARNKITSETKVETDSEWGFEAIVYEVSWSSDPPVLAGLYSTKRTGRWRWSDPDKEAFAAAIRYLDGRRVEAPASTESSEPVAPAVQSATVYVFRRGGEGDIFKEPPVFLDSREIARLDNGRYIELRLQPGSYIFSSSHAKREPVTLLVEPGNAYYLEMKVSFWADAGRLQPVAEEEAKQQLRKAKPLSDKFTLDQSVVVSIEH